MSDRTESSDLAAQDAALAQWTGRTRMRKGKGRLCAHWLLGERCTASGRRTATGFVKCKPPRADHCSTWGFGPRLQSFRVLCSQPYSEDSLPQSRDIDVWARAWDMTVMEWPDRSWHSPGGTTLHVIVPDHLARAMARGESCPGCANADAKWADYGCCWTAEIMGGWESRRLAAELMGEGA